MKFELSSPSRSRASHGDEVTSSNNNNNNNNSPMKKQKRTYIHTPASSPSETIFRPRRAVIFDDEKEDLLRIRRGALLQPIPTDLGDCLLEEEANKENNTILAMAFGKNPFVTSLLSSENSIFPGGTCCEAKRDQSPPW